MSPRLMRPATRWIVAAAALFVASALATSWHPEKHDGAITLTAVDMVPRIFTTPQAIAPPVAKDQCKGTPGKGDQLSITLKTISLKGTKPDPNDSKKTVDVETTILSTAKALNFANDVGASVGDYATDKPLEAGATYTKIHMSVGSTLTIQCSITCDAGSSVHPGSQTWVTKGGTTSTDTDDVGGTAVASSVSVNNGVDSSFDRDLATPITAGSSIVQLFFSNNAACQLYDIGNLLTPTTANKDFKIFVGAVSPSKVQ